MAKERSKAPTSPSPTSTPAKPASATTEKKTAASTAAQPQPFPWLVAAMPAQVRATSAEKFLAMHRHELTERATLLRRLGYSQDAVRLRLQGYELWEHEPFHRSKLIAEVPKIVADVFSTRQVRGTMLSPGV
jgi:hypothetical protein